MIKGPKLVNPRRNVALNLTIGVAPAHLVVKLQQPKRAWNEEGKKLQALRAQRLAQRQQLQVA